MDSFALQSKALQLKLLPPPELLLLLLSKAVESGDELLNGLILSNTQMSIIITSLLRWNNDMVWDVQNTILTHTISHMNVVVAINADVAETVKVGNVDGEGLALEQGLKVKVDWTHIVVSLPVVVFVGCLLIDVRVVFVGVEGLVGNDVVLQQHLKALQAALGEEEGVDWDWEAGPGTVVWREESETLVREVRELLIKAGLKKGQFQSGELGWHDRENLDG